VDNYTGLAQWPIQPTPKIGLDYGWQNQAAGQDAFFHSGVDLLAPLDTPVMAAAAGEVILVSQEGAYGFLVVIDHGNGRQTRYAHLSRFAVDPGEKVPAGTVIGYVGSTGRPDIASSHLHFEVRVQSPVGWAAQDPKLHLPRP
jgi:murein DD-endopeptidase MepM/ murein hydrolase activator NlpD